MNGMSYTTGKARPLKASDYSALCNHCGLLPLNANGVTYVESVGRTHARQNLGHKVTVSKTYESLARERE